MTPSEDGGYIAIVSNIPGCFTQGDSFDELYKMVNYAVYDYFQIPADYFPYIHSYSPPQAVIEEMKKSGERVPRELVFKPA